MTIGVDQEKGPFKLALCFSIQTVAVGSVSYDAEP